MLKKNTHNCDRKWLSGLKRRWLAWGGGFDEKKHYMHMWNLIAMNWKNTEKESCMQNILKIIKMYITTAFKSWILKYLQ